MKNITKKFQGLIYVALALLLCSILSAALLMFAPSKSVKADTVVDTSVKARTSAAMLSDDAAEETLYFLLINNDTEYKVRAIDKQVTKVVIPEEHNGLPVTEIADSGFSSCKQLVSVYIPASVTKIGRLAFYNCSSLVRISGMAKIDTIGANAFAGCTSLGNLIFPSTLETVGSSILKNTTNDVFIRMTEEQFTSKANVNASWLGGTRTDGDVIYGNKIACTEIFSETGDLMGYSIDGDQNFNESLSDIGEDIVLECVYYKDGNENDPYPILNVSMLAFSTMSCKTFTMNYNSAYGSDYAVNLESYALAYLDAEEININVNVTYNDIYGEEGLKSTFVLSEAQMRAVTIPDSFEEITESMFQDCVNLTTINNTNESVGSNCLSPKITSIDSSAFSGCTSLTSLTIPQSVSYIGDSSFTQWGSIKKQTLYFGVKTPQAAWHGNWNGGMTGDNVVLNYAPTRVALDKQDGTAGSDYADAIYGQIMPSGLTAPEPSSVHQVFMGYFSGLSGDSKCYYDENMVGQVVWGDEELNEENPVTKLYARWEYKDYEVKFYNNNMTEYSFSTLIRYSDSFPSFEASQKPVADGKIFMGYYTQPNGRGERYYDENLHTDKLMTEPIVTALYAYMPYVRVQIALNNGDGTGADTIYIEYLTNNVYANRTATDKLSLDAPTLEGYHFGGYYSLPNGAGEQYFSSVNVDKPYSATECVKDWTSIDGGTLYAYWAVKYAIHYTKSGSQFPDAHVSEIAIKESVNGVYKIPAPTDTTGSLQGGYKYVVSPSQITDADIGSDLTVSVSVVEKTLSECLNRDSGTYEIWTVTQLLDISKITVGNLPINGMFKLMNDLDLSRKQFSGFGAFAGYFNGSMHTIRGIDFTATNVYMGFFAINTGTIEKLNIVATMSDTKQTVTHAGMICAINNGIIRQCTTDTTSTYGITCNKAGVYVGGITGYNTGTLYNCVNKAAIRGSGNIGGITAYCGGNADGVELCRNFGKVNYHWVSGVHSVGGIIGVLERGAVSLCTNYAEIRFITDAMTAVGAGTRLGKIVGTMVMGAFYADTNNSAYATINSGSLSGTYDDDIGYIAPSI